MKERSQTLRKKVLERDNFSCRKCGFEDKSGKLLEVHHVLPLYNEGKDDLKNLITLCQDCHHFAPNNPEEFKKYLQEETTGTFTTFMKAFNKVKVEHPELFEDEK